MSIKTQKPIHTLAVLCSGGDSPGMNCALRAVVRTAISENLKVLGIHRGYRGLLENDFQELDASSVGNILQRGGTILKTSRCLEFLQPETREKAAHNLKQKNIDALVVIGGNGSFNGAYKLWEEHNIPTIGIPGTIDNDISNTDYTVGFDTAVQTAVEAVDKIRDTANSLARTFIVEVMGRRSPAIGFHVGICTGAESVIQPHKEINYREIMENIQAGLKRQKNSSVLIVCEGEKPGLSYQIQKTLSEQYGHQANVCILGHIQRGGRPSSLDRFLASHMGHLGVMSLLKGNFPIATCYQKGEITPFPLEQCLQKKDDYSLYSLDIIKKLSI